MRTKAFRAEADKRGIEKAETNGDLIVSLFVLGEIKTQTTANATTMGMGGMNTMGGRGRRGMGGPGWGWGTTHATTTYSDTQYLEGTIGIEVYNRVEKKLIWTASGTKTISDNPERRAKNIPRVVAEIMKKYPVIPLK